MTPKEILAKPYHRVIRPDEMLWFGEIVEFPGTLAVGRTAGDCAAQLEDVAESWLLATIDSGQDVPEPLPTEDFGRAVRKVFGRGETARLIEGQ